MNHPTLLRLEPLDDRCVPSATGRYAVGAGPGGPPRVQVYDSSSGKVIADLNGLWSLKVEKGMQPGHYAVRADEVEPESGKVLARAEVPFDFPATAPCPGITIVFALTFARFASAARI